MATNNIFEYSWNWICEALGITANSKAEAMRSNKYKNALRTLESLPYRINSKSELINTLRNSLSTESHFDNARRKIKSRINKEQTELVDLQRRHIEGSAALDRFSNASYTQVGVRLDNLKKAASGTTEANMRQ